MKKMGMAFIFILVIWITSCTPTPTPYISSLDPCDPDILTAIDSAGGIPRCDKIPTERPQSAPISIEQQRRHEVLSLLYGLIGDPRYDPSTQVLAKYINNIIEVDIGDNALHFQIDMYPTNNETDGISLAAELIYAGALASLAGELGDWNLGIIDVNYPADEVSCGVSFYVNNKNDLERINKGLVSIYDVMEVYVCEN